MNAPNSQASTANINPSRRVMQALDEAVNKLKAVDRAKHEPIAIIGVGCRFAQASSPEAFWQLLETGVDAVREVPAERWDVDAYYDADPDAPGKTYTRYGSFVDCVDRFDPAFFGISPREAATMDPQQRLLLEVSWEALERANWVPERQQGSQTGVFVGITTNDYARLLLGSADLEQINAHYSSGNALNAVAGRLSYTLGLQGPSMAIDTACSSSLVAVHLACQSLRQRECDAALAGGVNLILAPENTIALSKARMLSRDGRCKTFDASADGIVRGEGCGVIVLKRLSDAVLAGDPIQAVIRGSAVNQDGPSSGFTVPNAAAQQTLLRSALASAKLDAADVDYVEAHGTGTSLGDPIELRALGLALGEGRSADRPLQVGSVKTNLGHLESAAGIAGLIKVVLSLQNEAIPPHLHFQHPNPRVDWDSLPVKVTAAGLAWQRSEKPRVAGVSSFGASGTNAHVLLAETPCSEAVAEPIEAPPNPALHLLPLAAKSESALDALADSYQNYLTDNPPISLSELCHTAQTGRGHFSHRLAIAAASIDDLQTGLANYLKGETGLHIQHGYADVAALPQVAFLFTGQGSQYPGMGRELYESNSVFRSWLDECDRLLRPHL
ncbi:MAG: type I polyketide synthase, partial [Cyanobacteria bacterium P01_E01_bin.34]